ncbi:MAG: hypothetical protein LBD09_05165 [Treponema sp.]|jgi:hypothetical protein|nr:hypothetical protein [Treponema sp.]
MTGFTVKKFFYDLWDNFFGVMILNFGFLLSLSLAFVLPPLVPAAEFPWALILFGLLIYWLFLYLCTAALLLREVSDYRRVSLSGLGSRLKNALAPAALLCAALALILFVLRFTVPAYLALGGVAGLGAAFFSCWFCLFLAAAIQFYPAVYGRLGARPLKCLKKCALFFLDNTGFCLFALALNAVMIIPVIPCPGLPLLFLDEALRLRLLKYDWLEEQRRGGGPESGEGSGAVRPGRRGRTVIPWEALLAEEKEKTGTRSLRSFIFPWKD